jgi:hypothetical protein
MAKRTGVQPERPPVQPERVPLPLSAKTGEESSRMYDPTQFRRPLPTGQTHRSRVTGLRPRRIRHSASRQKPSGSLQGVPGAASFRGAFPPPGHRAVALACVWPVTRSTRRPRFSANNGRTRLVGQPKWLTLPARGRRPDCFQCRFQGSGSPGKAAGCWFNA